MAQITQTTFQFLKDLSQNNTREWFQAHRNRYEASLEEVRDFADVLIDSFRDHDAIDTPSGKKAIFRIYRDVRFSKNKAPYKTHWGGSMKRSGEERRGGFYFHIEPGNSFIAGGFWGPAKEDLLHIRQQIAADADPLRDVLASKNFQTHFGEMEGEQLKTSPKGFDKAHPNIDLLRFKQYLVYKKFTDKEVLSAGYLDKAVEGFAAMLPFQEVFSNYLTTDLNGVSLLEES